MHLLACARMPGLGPVLDVTAAVMPGEDNVEARAAQTAACTGAAPTGGLTLFEVSLTRVDEMPLLIRLCCSPSCCPASGTAWLLMLRAASGCFHRSA